MRYIGVAAGGRGTHLVHVRMRIKHARGVRMASSIYWYLVIRYCKTLQSEGNDSNYSDNITVEVL